MGIATRIGVAAAAVLTSGGLLLFGNLASASAHEDDGPTRLIESPDCAARDHAQATPASAGQTGGGLQQTITVTVPATVMLRVDKKGRITAAFTNTGCAPRPSDDIYVWQNDGTLALAPSKEIVRRTWTGDFTQPGVYVTQRG